MRSDHEIMAEQREQQKQLGHCPATKSFTHGDRSTALVVCQEEDPDHQGSHSRSILLPDGSTIDYRWLS